jgi:hypothetical protein
MMHCSPLEGIWNYEKSNVSESRLLSQVGRVHVDQCVSGVRVVEVSSICLRDSH